MLNVLIDDNQTRTTRVRQGEKNGKPWRIVSQRIWVHKPGRQFPDEYEITLPNGAEPYPPGKYQLNLEQLLSRDKWGGLSIDTYGGILLVSSNLSKAVA